MGRIGRDEKPASGLALIYLVPYGDMAAAVGDIIKLVLVEYYVLTAPVCACGHIEMTTGTVDGIQIGKKVFLKRVHEVPPTFAILIQKKVFFVNLQFIITNV